MSWFATPALADFRRLPQWASGRSLTLTALWLCALASIAQAQETRVALIIGNSAYTAVPRLPNPTSDATAVAQALKGLGFKTVQVESNLGSDALRRALRDFAAEADQADWAMIYYAGHGIEVGGTNYLIPVDAKLRNDRDVQFEAVSLDQALTSIAGARKLRLVVLDACRDNPFVSQMTPTIASRSIGRGLAQVEPETGTLVAYAAKAGQIAYDGDGQNSPFVASLLKRLPEPGVEINMLFRAVRDDVLRVTAKKQEPFVYGSLPNEAFYFKPAAALPVPPAEAGTRRTRPEPEPVAMVAPPVVSPAVVRPVSPPPALVRPRAEPAPPPRAASVRPEAAPRTRPAQASRQKDIAAVDEPQTPKPRVQPATRAAAPPPTSSSKCFSFNGQSFCE